jgi:hypothetical protein
MVPVMLLGGSGRLVSPGTSAAVSSAYGPGVYLASLAFLTMPSL